MSIFKIKLTPVVKESDFKISYVSSGRKEKLCNCCGKKIPIGYSATTFTKKKSTGLNKEFTTFYTCGLQDSKCTKKKAKELNVDL
jgi:hypothetical protein